MLYTKLGNSELKVSRICLGGMGFGNSRTGQHTWTVNKNDTLLIVRKALDAGINFFDTAIAYQKGTGEEYLGDALKQSVARDRVVIATKFLPRSAEDIQNEISGQQHIERQLTKSLEHLKTDYVDLYIYHMWDYHTPMHDILEGLDLQIKKGRIRYIGIANCFAWQLAEINALARAEGFSEFVSVQNHYNLIFREEEREMSGLCREKNIAVTPYSPLASGRLSRLPDTVTRRMQEDSYAHLKYDAAAQEDAKIILRLKETADQYEASMTQTALAWLLTKADAPVVGASRASQIDDMQKACDLKLDPLDIHYLEELYRPHPLVGVMAQNTVSSDESTLVWMQNRAR